MTVSAWKGPWLACGERVSSRRTRGVWGIGGRVRRTAYCGRSSGASPTCPFNLSMLIIRRTCGLRPRPHDFALRNKDDRNFIPRVIYNKTLYSLISTKSFARTVIHLYSLSVNGGTLQCIRLRCSNL